MLTVQDMHDAIQAAIQRAEQSKNTAHLAELQQLAGYLMRPASAAKDTETERKFRMLASKAANLREDILKDDR